MKVIKHYPMGGYPRVKLKEWLAHVPEMDMENAEVETSWMVEFQMNGEGCRTTKCNLHTDVDAYEFVRNILKQGAELVRVCEMRKVLVWHEIKEDDACGRLMDKEYTEILTAEQSPVAVRDAEIDELIAGSKSFADFDRKYGALEHTRHVVVDDE